MEDRAEFEQLQAEAHLKGLEDAITVCKIALKKITEFPLDCLCVLSEDEMSHAIKVMVALAEAALKAADE